MAQTRSHTYTLTSNLIALIRGEDDPVFDEVKKAIDKALVDNSFREQVYGPHLKLSTAQNLQGDVGEVFSLMEDPIPLALQPFKASQLSSGVYSASLLPSVVFQQATLRPYCAPHTSNNACWIFFRYEGRKCGGCLQTIISYTNIEGINAVALVVQSFKELSQHDASFDYFRLWEDVAGKLFYASLDVPIVIPYTDILQQATFSNFDYHPSCSISGAVHLMPTSKVRNP